MIKYVVLSIIELLIVTPIILLSLNKTKDQWKKILLFAGFFIFNAQLLVLPIQYEKFKFINGQWNWSGKLLAIIGSIVFYYLFRSKFRENDFLTLVQKQGSVKPTVVVTLLVLIVGLLSAYFLFGQSGLSMETLGFQLTMPGIDEEIAFRGIMMGLLISALKPTIMFGKINLGNPSVWITAILFGLIHALDFDDRWMLTMNWIYFSYTFLLGCIWGWMVIKSRSILMPIVSHNSTNFFGSLITMVK